MNIVNDINPLRKSLVRKGREHWTAHTNSTDYLFFNSKGHKQTFMSVGGTGLTFKELGFMNQVKAHAKALELSGLVGYMGREINYFQFKGLQNGVYEEIIELDVNSAYWNIAHQNKFINKPIYDKGNDSTRISKKARLAALGSLATRKEFYRYDPDMNQYRKEESRFNPITASYFFGTAKDLDTIMMEVYERHGILFYWVDAFFLPTFEAEKVAATVAKYGLGIKEKRIERMEVKGSFEQKQVCIYDPGEEQPRVFNFNIRAGKNY